MHHGRPAWGSPCVAGTAFKFVGNRGDFIGYFGKLRTHPLYRRPVAGTDFFRRPQGFGIKIIRRAALDGINQGFGLGDIGRIARQLNKAGWVVAVGLATGDQQTLMDGGVLRKIHTLGVVGSNHHLNVMIFGDVFTLSNRIHRSSYGGRYNFGKGAGGV